MALKLRIVSDQYKQLGKESVRMFGVTGGRIGRAPDNDWVLPDPERYVSSHHGQVSFRSGQWILEDISTNGIFVNDSDTALSVTGPRKLKDGDRLRFGDYDILVNIDERNDFPPDASGQMPRPALPRSKPKSKPRTRDHLDDDLGEELDITGLFQARTADDDDVMAGLDGGPPLQAAPKPPQAAPTVEVEDLFETSEHEITLTGNETAEAWHMSTRRLQKRASIAPEPVAVNVVANKAPVVARIEPAIRRESVGDTQNLFESFCRGAGIDVGNLSNEGQAAMLTLGGQMLREVMLDLMEALKPRGEQAGSASPAPNNPIKAAASVEEALRKLLLARSNRQLGAVDALRDAFGDLRDQRLASDTATQAAIDDLLHRLNPVELQERFNRGLQRAAVPATAYKTKYWELFTEFFPLLNQRDTRGMPAVFSDEFARIYAEKLAELEQKRRK